MDPYFYVHDSTGRAWVIRRSDSLAICECTSTDYASLVADALNAAA